MRPDELKAAVDILTAAERYGLEVNRKGYASCPFHEEDTPSLKLYPETNTFYCFGCGMGGDVISFVRHLFHLDYAQAVVRICSDFGLTLDCGGTNRRKAAEIGRIQAARKAVQREARGEYMQQIGLFAALWKVRSTCAPKSPEEGLHPAFIEALHELDYIDYWLAAHPWK